MSTSPQVPGVELREKLGEGGFGAVYKARHIFLDVDIAVKFILASRIEDPAAIELALAEARLMARLDHPNLLRIYDAGRVNGSIYLTLELMDGTCEKLRHVAADTAFEFSRQLLGGLQALHEAKIIHRDIKPANCLLRSRDNRVKLGDLGIAVRQATRTKEQDYNIAGTLPFMAPEVFQDPPKFGPSTDLYALGMTLACMFLDANPFPAGSRSELFAWIMSDTRPRVTALRPDIPNALSSLIERLIAPDPGRRPRTAADALISLSEAAMLASRDDADQNPAPSVRSETTRMIGPWLLGERVYTSPNWNHYAVTHIRTGAPGRLAEVKSRSVLEDARETILSSAERASQLTHPGIVDVLDWGTSSGSTYVVTAPQGKTLQSVVEAQGPLGELEAVEFVLSLAEALMFLHSHGLVYETVDPGSAVISANAREAQLAWPLYCVPRGTSASDALGKPVRVWVMRWAPPEVVLEPGAGTIEPAVDIYGLGEILFFLLAGRPAFHITRGATAIALAKLQKIPDVRESAPATTAPTASLVRQLLAADPAHRPDSRSAREALAKIRSRLSSSR